MATDLTVVLEDRRWTLADNGEVLGNAGVKMDDLAAITANGKGVVHILVEDAGAAREALKSACNEVGEARNLIALDLGNKSGMSGAINRKIAESKTNIELAYLASGARLVIGADDLEKSAAAI